MIYNISWSFVLRFCIGLHIHYFSRTLEKWHEENDSVYKTAILLGNYVKHNAYFDGIHNMQIEYNSFKDNFQKVIENIKNLE